MFWNWLRHTIHLERRANHIQTRTLLVLIWWHDSPSIFVCFFERWLALSIRPARKRILASKCLKTTSLRIKRFWKRKAINCYLCSLPSVNSDESFSAILIAYVRAVFHRALWLVATAMAINYFEPQIFKNYIIKFARCPYCKLSKKEIPSKQNTLRF